MIAAVPVPPRCVLAELQHGTAAGDGDGVLSVMSPALARAFAQFDTAIDAHAASITALDRIGDALAATHGYPCVSLPADDAANEAVHFASDAATIARHLGTGTPAARRLTAELCRRQRTFARAAAAAGLGPARARARETRAARTVSAATAILLLIPAHTPADLALKITVLIAAGEHTNDDARAFPWLYLRAILADLSRPDRPEQHSRR